MSVHIRSALIFTSTPPEFLNWRDAVFLQMLQAITADKIGTGTHAVLLEEMRVVHAECDNQTAAAALREVSLSLHPPLVAPTMPM